MNIYVYVIWFLASRGRYHDSEDFLNAFIAAAVLNLPLNNLQALPLPFPLDFFFSLLLNNVQAPLLPFPYEISFFRAIFFCFQYEFFWFP